MVLEFIASERKTNFLLIIPLRYITSDFFRDWLCKVLQKISVENIVPSNTWKEIYVSNTKM